MDTEATKTPRYWVNTVSREHVLRGVAGGFMQADHGRPTRLQRMAKGDRIVFYSPRTELGGGEALQAFTAIGEVLDDATYQVEVSEDFKPWRRNVDFGEFREAPVRPLLPQLDFIRNKESWGIVFRRGFFEIAERDFRIIEAAMECAGSSG
jgi:hypothetical protein